MEINTNKVKLLAKKFKIKLIKLLQIYANFVRILKKLTKADVLPLCKGIQVICKEIRVK